MSGVSLSATRLPVADKDYSHRPVAAKLGIKDGMRVCILGAPPGFADALKPLPATITLSARPEPPSDLYLCVVRTVRDLDAYVSRLPAVITTQTLWLIWPKKTARSKTELNGNIVRDTGLASGWVDFKVCSVDETWSALAFKRRRR
jgi:hypothetical protein